MDLNKLFVKVGGNSRQSFLASYTDYKRQSGQRSTDYDNYVVFIDESAAGAGDQMIFTHGQIYSVGVGAFDKVKAELNTYIGKFNNLITYTYNDVEYTADKLEDYVGWYVDTKADFTKLNSSVTAETGYYLTGVTEENGLLTSYTQRAIDEYSVIKLETAESGFTASYKLTKNGVETGTTINIPNVGGIDKAGVVELAAAVEAGDTVQFTNGTEFQTTEAHAAGTYMVIITDNGDQAWLDAHSLVTQYSADNSTLEMNNNVFSIKEGGITISYLSQDLQDTLTNADSAVQSVVGDAAYVGDGFVKVKEVFTYTDTAYTLTSNVQVTTQTVLDAAADNDGLATAYNVAEAISYVTAWLEFA